MGKVKSKAKSNLYGPLMMLGAALCFSGGGAAIKFITWDSFAINGTRNLMAAVIIGIFMLATRHKLKVNLTVLLGAACLFGVTTLFIMANKMTTAANAIIIQYTAPVWVMILMFVIFRQKPDRLQIGTIAVVLLGIICFFLDSISSGHMAGDMVALASGVCYAVVFMLNSFEKGDALSSVFLGQVMSAIIQCPFVLRETDFSTPVIGGILFLGLIQVGLAYIFFTEGTKYAGAVAASLIASLEPILNPVWVALIWGEMIKPLSLAGGCIVIAAIAGYNLLNIKKNTQDKLEEKEHE